MTTLRPSSFHSVVCPRRVRRCWRQHAASFTATFLGGLRLIERLSPPTSASAAQSLNSSVANGVLTGLATVAVGPLFDAFGAMLQSRLAQAAAYCGSSTEALGSASVSG